MSKCSCGVMNRFCPVSLLCTCSNSLLSYAVVKQIIDDDDDVGGTLDIMPTKDKNDLVYIIARAIQPLSAKKTKIYLL